jgi:hypothetical protein
VDSEDRCQIAMALIGVWVGFASDAPQRSAKLTHCHSLELTL